MPSRESEDQRTLGLSEDAHVKLTRLKEDGHFNDMRDAYRLAISVALAEGLIAPKSKPLSRTYINVGSLDPDGILRSAILEHFQGREGQPYEVAARLGEEGVLALTQRLERNPQFSELFRQPDLASDSAGESVAVTNRPSEP